MSFSVDLWNGFDVIRKQLVKNINKINLTSNILSLYTNYEIEFANRLESIFENKDIYKEIQENKTEFSIQVLLNYLKNESEVHKQNSEYIIKYILAPLKDSTDEIKNSYDNDFTENLKNEENFKKVINNLILAQKKYHNNLKDFKTYLFTLTKTELDNYINNYKIYIKENNNQNNIDDSLNISTINNQPITIKKHKLIDKIFSSKNEYISCISEINEEVDFYNKKTEKILNNLEVKYMKLVNIVQLTLINLINNKISIYNKLLQLNKSSSNTIVNKISPRIELFNFIKQNATKEFPINKFEYIPYKISQTNNNFETINQFLIDSCLNCFDTDSAFIKLNRKASAGLVKSSSRQSIMVKKTLPKNARNTSVSKINSKYSAGIDEYKIKTNMFFIEDFIDELTFVADNSNEIKNNINQINENDEQKLDIKKIETLFNKFKTLFSNTENNTNIYLETLIKSLNYYRSKGLFVLNKISYDCLIDIFKLLLKNFSSCDFLLKNILILAQTFYIKKEENNKKIKIFLQQGLKNHSLFNKAETWHRVINYTLNVNVINKDITNKIDKNELNNKLGLLAFNTLVSYLNDLIYFTDDMSLFDEVKDFYVTIYKLDINQINEQLKEILGDKLNNMSMDNK